MDVKNLLRAVMAVACVLPVLFLYQNCSDVRLKGIPGGPINIASSGALCVSPPATAEQQTKFLFVIDKSGSNNETDPGGVRRMAGMRGLYNTYGSDPLTRWSIISFQGGSAQAEIAAGGIPIFTADGNLVNTAINSFSAGDNDSTPYIAALSLARTAIDADIRQNPTARHLYNVIFLSDGVPQPPVTDDVLDATVRGLVSLSPNRILLSTGFYTGATDNPEARARLARMASVGSGRFVDFGNGSLNLDGLVFTGQFKEPWVIKRELVLVYNVTSAICADGVFDTDSDADGLCDRDETAYNQQNIQSQGARLNFDPTNRNSNQTFPSGAPRFPYFSDYFALELAQTNAIPPICNNPATAGTDIDFDLVDECEERFLSNPTPQNPWSDPSQIAYANNPDSDGDGFLDGIELLTLRRAGAAQSLNRFNVDQLDFVEGITIGAQIRQHRNPLLPDAGAPAYDTFLSYTGQNATGQSCYVFSQTTMQVHPTLAVAAGKTLPGLEHAAGENVIMLYYIKTPQGYPDSRGVLEHSYQKVNFANGSNGFGGGGLRLDRFQSYVVPIPQASP
jgi:hypothetical protein